MPIQSSKRNSKRNSPSVMELRARDPRPAAAEFDSIGRWLTVAVSRLTGVHAWRSLVGFLNSIPDSNDDFGFY